MKRVQAVLSMLHENAASNSGTRLFRDRPVLDWTLRRISMAKKLTGVTVACFADQTDAIYAIAGAHDVEIYVAGNRRAIMDLDAVSAARRWADGWRGGLHGTCDFDAGFHADSVLAVMERHESDAVILIDPAAGLIDGLLLDRIVDHANEQDITDIAFTQAAPGLAGTLLTLDVVQKLKAAKTHPGRLLVYTPDQPARDPIGLKSCLSLDKSLTRQATSYKLDSARQIARLSAATISLNGQLIKSDAEALVERVAHFTQTDPTPREITLELCARRVTAPIYRPAANTSSRDDLSLDIAKTLFNEIGNWDDVRLTLSGVGDPLLHPQFFEIIESARAAGVRAIHVETDLLPENLETIARLALANVDVISVHIPAMSPDTYEQLMGVPMLTQVIQNVTLLARARAARGSGVPLIVPVFAKCSQNLPEMEQWYDQWIKAVGAAVVIGPSDYAGQIPDVAVADMAPQRRGTCSRVQSRMTVLSDGQVVSCEEDFAGKMSMGRVGEQLIADIWLSRFGSLRRSHSLQQFDAHPLCGNCREWHRP